MRLKFLYGRPSAAAPDTGFYDTSFRLKAGRTFFLSSPAWSETDALDSRLPGSRKTRKKLVTNNAMSHISADVNAAENSLGPGAVPSALKNTLPIDATPTALAIC